MLTLQELGECPDTIGSTRPSNNCPTITKWYTACTLGSVTSPTLMLASLMALRTSTPRASPGSSDRLATSTRPKCSVWAAHVPFSSGTPNNLGLGVPITPICVSRPRLSHRIMLPGRIRVESGAHISHYSAFHPPRDGQGFGPRVRWVQAFPVPRRP